MVRSTRTWQVTTPMLFKREMQPPPQSQSHQPKIDLLGLKSISPLEWSKRKEEVFSRLVNVLLAYLVPPSRLFPTQLDIEKGALMFNGNGHNVVLESEGGATIDDNTHNNTATTIASNNNNNNSNNSHHRHSQVRRQGRPPYNTNIHPYKYAPTLTYVPLHMDPCPYYYILQPPELLLFSIVFWLLAGLPRVSVASIDESVLTTLAVHMSLRGQVDMLISILRSCDGYGSVERINMVDKDDKDDDRSKRDGTVAHPWDRLWLQVAHHLCERKDEPGCASPHQHRELLSLLMRLSDEDVSQSHSQSNSSSQVGIDPIASQISPRSPSQMVLISRSGFLAMVRLTAQKMIDMGESHRAEQLTNAWKI